MAFSNKCSICTHPYGDTINDLLRRRARGESEVTYKFICARMEELGHPVTECALSRHASKHFNVVAVAQEKAAKQLNEASDEAAKKIVSDVEFLDKVIQKTVDGLDEGELSPDIAHGIRAVEVKHKVMKGGDPLADLLDAIAGGAGAVE